MRRFSLIFELRQVPRKIPPMPRLCLAWMEKFFFYVAMSRTLFTRFGSLGLTCVLLVSLVMSGVAHKLQAPSDTLDPAVEAYLAAGGSLADICGTGTGDDQVVIAECEACFFKNAIVPVAAVRAAPWDDAAPKPLDVSQADRVLAAHDMDLARACRAPPVA